MTARFDETGSGRYPLIDELLDEADEMSDEADEMSDEAGGYPGQSESFDETGEYPGQFEAPGPQGRARQAAPTQLTTPCADCGPGVACEVLDRFGFDRDGVTAAHAARLKAIAARIAQSHATGRPILTVRVIGHTDRVGTDQYNLELGRRRARTVARALAAELQKVPVTRSMTFQVGSRGESRPVSSDAARNRRVEVCLIPAAVPRPRPCNRQELDRLVRECTSVFRRCVAGCGFDAVIDRIKQIPALAPCLRLRFPPAIIACVVARGGKSFIDNILNTKRCVERCRSNQGLCGTNARSAAGCPQST